MRSESDTPDVDSDLAAGQYYGSVDMAAITIGDWSLARGTYYPDPELTAHDIVVGYYPPDLFGTESQIDLYDPTGTFGSFVLMAISLSIRTPGIITSDAMLIDPPELASVDPFHDPLGVYGPQGSGVFLFGAGAGGYSTFQIELSSLQRVDFTPPLPVALPENAPEPGFFALLALAAAGVSGRSLRARLRA